LEKLIAPRNFQQWISRRLFAAGLLAFLCATIPRCPAQASPDREFSAPQAYALLQTLVRDIGPRPMGSPAEQRALAFAAAKFREYGCDTGYIHPMKVAEGVNTRSGVAIGIARGKTGRMIVIGGHIDSSGPEVPGANDDGSGVACVMELARVLAPRDRLSTLVFCCFGGEEEGLQGSSLFVKEFPFIDSVALMIQIDMTDGASFLEMDPDAAFQVSAPRWLPEAAFDVYYNELGFKDLRYLTHSSTLNSSTPGGAGSDHIPFIEKGIPAIDFTSDVTYPIHTPLDNLALFDSSGLARTGLLVQRLVERFDTGTPSRDTEEYYLLQIGTSLLFVDHWMLWAIHVCTIAIASVAFAKLRRNRIRDKSAQPRWSGAKLILAALLIQGCIWFPETILGAIRSYRFPWVNNFGGYAALGVMCGALGLWFALHMLHRLRVSTDPYPYFFRAFLFLVASLVALMISNPEIALYGGSVLLFFSLAVLVQNPVVKGALALAACYLPLRLVFLESLGLLQRGWAQSVIDGWWKVGLVDAGYVLVFTILSLPFVFGFAAVYTSAGCDLYFLKQFRKKAALIVLLPAIGILAVVLLNRPVYDPRWERSVRAEQRYEIGSDSSVLVVRGAEFLDGLHVGIAGRDSVLLGELNVFSPRLEKPSKVEWLAVSSRQEIQQDTSVNDSSLWILRTVELTGTRRPLLVEIKYRSDQPFELRSRWSTGARRARMQKSEKVRTLTWYAFPDSVLEVPVTLTMKPGQKLIEGIVVTYPELAAPVTLRRELTTVITRTVVSRTDTIALKPDAGL